MVDPAGRLPQVTDAPSSKPARTIVDPVATSKPTGGTRVAITIIDVAGIGKDVVTGSKRIGGRRLAPSSARTAGDPAAAADRMPGGSPEQLSPQRCARLQRRPNEPGRAASPASGDLQPEHCEELRETQRRCWCAGSVGFTSIAYSVL